MYFQLKFDVFCDFGISFAGQLPTGVNFLNGSVISEPLPLPLPYVTDGTKGSQLPDFWGGEVPIMSQRFLKILQRAGADNIQAFPAVVRSEVDGAQWDNYVAFNLLGIIRCADLNHSEYTEICPGLYVFDRLAIEADKALGARLFRLDESPSTIIISKDLAKQLLIDKSEGEVIGWDVEDIIQ